MRALLSLRFSPEFLWSAVFFLLSLYLLFHPALDDPRSYAVVLGGGLLLLTLRPLREDAWGTMGKFWWIALLFTLASAFWSFSPGTTLRSTGLLALGALLYLMASSLDQAGKRRSGALGFLMAVGVAVLALHQWTFGFERLQVGLASVPPEDLGVATAFAFNERATGPLLTPGALAALMVFFIPWGVAQVLVQRGSKRNLYLLGTCLLGGALLASQSIGALLCLAASALLVLVVKRSFRWALVALGVGGLAVLVVFALRREDWVVSALSGRSELWGTAWSLFLSHPLLGTGLGTFEEAYRASGANLSQGAKFAHNLPLQLLVETGLVGMSLFLMALVGMVRRLRIPSLWEGWGVMTGACAILLFSFLDLPFQMSELVFLFCGVLGILELGPEKSTKTPTLPPWVLVAILLAVLLVAGFWPPFRPWNFTLLAVALWGASGYLRGSVERLPIWVILGCGFLGLKALTSPSALGGVRSLETAGLALCFILILRALPAKEDLLKKFLFLGLAWGAGAWVFSFLGKPFEAWTGFPNPKHLAVFLVPLALLHLPGKGSGWKANLTFAAALATLVKLRATAALLGLLVGSLFHPRIKRTWKVLLLVSLVGAAGWVHSHQPSSTKWDRVLIWKAAVKVWAQAPLTGLGPGAFAGEFHRVKEPRQAELGRYLMDARFAHNEFLEFLVSFGLLGMVFLGALLWYVIRKRREERPALAGFAVPSMLDFCLHAPLNVLQAAGFMTEKGKMPNGRSVAGGLLAGLTALGLFGSACFAPVLVWQVERAKGEGKYKEALRALEKAEKLNPWDARFAATKADFLEELYISTGDKVWMRKSDEAFERVLDLESSDGTWELQNARRTTARTSFPALRVHEWTPAEQAWADAVQVLPLNAFVYFERGLFRRSLADVWFKFGKKQALELALPDFKRAVQLEPSFAAAWAWLGRCELELGLRTQARFDMGKALGIHRRWKDAPGLGPVERELVTLTPEVEAFLLKEIFR